MTIAAVQPSDIIQTVAQALKLPTSDATLSVPLVAQALRRAVHILAPCSRVRLESAVASSLSGLGVADDEVRTVVGDTLEKLLVFNEILEMRRSAEDRWDEAPLVLRPAPPMFVLRSDQSAILLGVAGEEITPLPAELDQALIHVGTLRVLPPQQGIDLRSLLAELDIFELTEAAWLRLPAIADPKVVIAEWRTRLAGAPQSGSVSGLMLLDPGASPRFYAGRWTTPSPKHSGMYVARRPQKFGAPLWCLTHMKEGAPTAVVDLYADGDRARPCDIAWHLQMAIDATANRPQQYRVVQEGEGCSFEFFSPIPAWAERRIAVLGTRSERPACLFSYHVSVKDRDEIERFLQRYLWLGRAD